MGVLDKANTGIKGARAAGGDLVAIASLVKKFLPLIIKTGFFLIFAFVALFSMIFISFGEKDAASASSVGACSGGAYVPLGPGQKGPNMSIVAIAASVVQQKTSNLPADEASTIMLSTFETALKESGFTNEANDGIRHGAEDGKTSDPGGTDADLAIAAQSMQFPPYDKVGSDHSSVGVMQQQNWWGSVQNRLTPSWAIGQFVDRAIAAYPQAPGGAAQLAQKVQNSATPDAYKGYETTAQDLINKSTTADNAVSCAGGIGKFTPGSTQQVSSNGTTYNIVIPTGQRGVAMGYALNQLGKLYSETVDGGLGPDEYDCSGLMLMSWKQAGFTLPRVSEDQWSAVPRSSTPTPGDLVFAEQSAKGPGHVGMFIVDNKGTPYVLQSPHSKDKTGSPYWVDIVPLTPNSNYWLTQYGNIPVAST